MIFRHLFKYHNWNCLIFQCNFSGLPEPNCICIGLDNVDKCDNLEKWLEKCLLLWYEHWTYCNNPKKVELMFLFFCRKRNFLRDEERISVYKAVWIIKYGTRL